MHDSSVSRSDCRAYEGHVRRFGMVASYNRLLLIEFDHVRSSRVPSFSQMSLRKNELRTSERLIGGRDALEKTQRMIWP